MATSPARPRQDGVDEDALVRQHLPLVGYLLNELACRLPSHVSRDDLSSAGLAALAGAARAWDPGTGVPFSRYASPRIRGAFLDELRGADWASRGARSRSRAVTTEESRLAALLGRTPTVDEIAAALGTTPEEVRVGQAHGHRSVVLSIQRLEEAGDETASLLPDSGPGPEALVLSAERLGYLRDAVDALPDRLRAVVQGYFLEDRPMAELAAELGVTESRISQLRAEALLLLRDGLNASLDPEQVSDRHAPEGVAVRRRRAYYAAVAARSTPVARVQRGAADRAAVLASA